MDAKQKALKRQALILWDAIRKNNVEKITEVFSDGFPVDHPITDSHLNALSYACTRCTQPQIF